MSRVPPDHRLDYVRTDDIADPRQQIEAMLGGCHVTDSDADKCRHNLWAAQRALSEICDDKAQAETMGVLLSEVAALRNRAREWRRVNEEGDGVY